MYLRRRILIDVRHALDYPVRVVLRGGRGNAVGDGQVAARREVIAVLGDDLMGLLLVRHEVQGADAQNARRLGEVELGEDLRVPEDLGRPAQFAVRPPEARPGRVAVLDGGREVPEEWPTSAASRQLAAGVYRGDFM